MSVLTGRVIRLVKQNLGKMYDPIVGIDVLDNWDEITSVVNR